MTHLKIKFLKAVCISRFFFSKITPHDFFSKNPNIDTYKTNFNGRLGKWALALSEYSLNYLPQKAVKWQKIADFLADHPNVIPPDEEEYEVINLKS